MIVSEQSVHVEGSTRFVMESINASHNSEKVVSRYQENDTEPAPES